MLAIIVKKTIDNLTTSFSNYTPTLNKFILKTFNQLFYNWEISRLLIVSYLLNLFNHYFLKTMIKTINIVLFQAKFLLILNSKSFNYLDNIVYVHSIKIWLCLIYKYYMHCSFAFNRISIYKYLQFVSIIK